MTIKLLGQGSLYDIHRRKQQRERSEWTRVLWFIAAFTVVATAVIAWIVWL